MVHAPPVPTRVKTKFLWPGELAQSGTPIVALLDPRDQYVQIYVPVADLPRVRVGQRVAIELDSSPGTRVPGEISFIADRANFTPEKIETRDDRLGPGRSGLGGGEDAAGVGIVARGLIAYGVYKLAQARYHRVLAR